MSLGRDLPDGLFDFERELTQSLKSIPMAVRYKLDLIGLRVSPTAWNRLSLATRKQLLHEWPVATRKQRVALREWLVCWLRTTSTEPPREVPVAEPIWDELSHVPEGVAELTVACSPPFTLGEWAGLDLLERVALVKLAQSPAERGKVVVALEEFRARRERRAA
jgi:hypothetical protein